MTNYLMRVHLPSFASVSFQSCNVRQLGLSGKLGGADSRTEEES